MGAQKQHARFIETAPKEWIAVGDASRFIIFERKKTKAYASIKSFSNEKAHEKISDLERDQPGRSFDSFASKKNGQAGVPRHAYTSPQDPKEHAVEQLVKDVSEFLNDAHNLRSFDRLTIVANSRLLGKLRDNLREKTKEAISAEHCKDFAWLTGQALEERVQELVAVS